MTGQYTIRPLSPNLLNEYLTFFDRDAFEDNPHWASCYCYFNLAPHHEKDWGTRTREENRAAVSQLIAAGRMHGYLAYVNKKVVGWCHAAPRLAIPNLQTDPDLQIEDAEQVGAIVCFVVAKPFRYQGVGRSLLLAACEGFKSQGLVYAEGYPRTDTRGEAQNYHGPLQMYQTAGFEVYRELPGVAIVRKRLSTTF